MNNSNNSSNKSQSKLYLIIVIIVMLLLLEIVIYILTKPNYKINEDHSDIKEEYKTTTTIKNTDNEISVDKYNIVAMDCGKENCDYKLSMNGTDIKIMYSVTDDPWGQANININGKLNKISGIPKTLEYNDNLIIIESGATSLSSVKYYIYDKNGDELFHFNPDTFDSSYDYYLYAKKYILNDNVVTLNVSPFGDDTSLMIKNSGASIYCEYSKYDSNYSEATYELEYKNDTLSGPKLKTIQKTIKESVDECKKGQY